MPSQTLTPATARERRGSRRHKPVNAQRSILNFILADQGRSLPVMLNDISVGGCNLRVAVPLSGAGPATVMLPPVGGEPPLALQAEIMSCDWVQNAWACHLRFLPPEPEELGRLARLVHNPEFVRAGDETDPHWTVDAWADYLTSQRLPVLARTKQALQDRWASASEAAQAPACEYAALAHDDPFLGLALLRAAPQKPATVLAAILQLTAGVRYELVTASPDEVESAGLMPCAERILSAGTSDASRLAATLDEAGELLLWHFAPDLPLAAREMQLASPGAKPDEAQRQACGFTFAELTQGCLARWGLR